MREQYWLSGGHFGKWQIFEHFIGYQELCNKWFKVHSHNVGIYIQNGFRNMKSNIDDNIIKFRSKLLYIISLYM